MMTSDDASFKLLDGLLSESVVRWELWRAEHPQPIDTDRNVAVMGELIETLLPTSDATLQHLAVDPRVWTHPHGSDEGTVRGSVHAALTSLIVDHLDTLAYANISRTTVAGD